MKLLFEPFDEFERIARNRPHPNVPKQYPKVTDGTTASIVKKTPRRIVQQVPTALVESDDEYWAIVATYIYQSIILPNANSQYDLIQKCWNVIEKSLTYGSQPAYTYFTRNGDYIGTDFILPYIRDVFLEKGKVSDQDSNFIFLRSWYQPRDIKAIIEKEKKLQSEDKEYKSEWDLEALARLQDMISAKEDEATTPAEKEKQTDNGGVEIIHAFQRGIEAEFYSFHRSSGEIVRTTKNPDPRGELPITYMYAETDGSNPLGRGFVELVGSLQNLLDSEMQMYQYNRALMLNPPLIKRGNFPKSQIKFVPNIVIDVGNDQNADVKPLSIDTISVNNFANNYGLMKSQLLNLLSSPDTSVSSEIGNPGFSKTPAGVDARMSTMNVDDNYIRKQYEAWFEKVSETLINLYFAEKQGIEALKVDKATAEKLSKLDPSLVNENMEVLVDYDQAKEALRVKVDASTSQVKDNTEELERSLQLLEINGKFGLAEKGLLNERELVDRVVVKLGLEDPEKIVPSEEEYQQTQMMQQQQMMAEQDAMAQMAQAAGQVAQPLPPEEAPRPQLDPEEAGFMEQLMAFGLDENQAMQASQMINEGASIDEVLAALGGE